MTGWEIALYKPCFFCKTSGHNCNCYCFLSQGSGRVYHHSFSQRMRWGIQTRGVEHGHSFPSQIIICHSFQALRHLKLLSISVSGVVCCREKPLSKGVVEIFGRGHAVNSFGKGLGRIYFIFNCCFELSYTLRQGWAEHFTTATVPFTGGPALKAAGRAFPLSSSVKEACLWSLFPDSFFSSSQALMDLKIRHNNKQHRGLGHRHGNWSYSQVSGKPSVAPSWSRAWQRGRGEFILSLSALQKGRLEIW